MKLKEIFEKFPKFSNYLTERQRKQFMCNDDGFIGDLEQWRQDAREALLEAKKQLTEILASQLMKDACKFAPWVKERWLGQLSVILELLGEAEAKGEEDST